MPYTLWPTTRGGVRNAGYLQHDLLELHEIAQHLRQIARFIRYHTFLQACPRGTV
jgi:hypothetical protein